MKSIKREESKIDSADIEQEITDRNDNRIKITAVAGFAAVVGFITAGKLNNPDSNSVIASIACGIGYAGSYVFVRNMFKIMEEKEAVLEKREEAKREAKLNSKLEKYGIDREVYEEYHSIDSCLTPERCKYIIDSGVSATQYKDLHERRVSIEEFKRLESLNITLDEARSLSLLGITLKEYVKYRDNSTKHCTPESYFVDTIHSRMPNGKLIVASSILAVLSAGAAVYGAANNMSSTDAETAIKFGTIGMYSILSLISFGALTANGISTRFNLNKNYKAITGEDINSRPKVMKLQ